MTQLFLYYYIFVLFSVTLSQDLELFRLSSDGCNPQLSDCDQVEVTCADVAPPTMTLTCQQILDNQLCALPDVSAGNYCQTSCGTCGKCGTTMLGCRCKKQWSFGQEELEGCSNPDGDEFGTWCEIEPDSCVGFNNTVYSVKSQKYDYCSKDCSQEYKVVPYAQNMTQTIASASTTSNQACKEGQIPTAKLSRKPNVVISVVGARIFVITNFDQEAVPINGWKILDGLKVELEFGSFCPESLNQTLGSLDSMYLEYGSGTCGVFSVPSQYMRLVDEKERVISNVNTTGVTGDLVSCYQNGQHVLVDTLQCQWL